MGVTKIYQGWNTANPVDFIINTLINQREQQRPIKICTVKVCYCGQLDFRQFNYLYSDGDD
jgi:hypothetical protein